MSRWALKQIIAPTVEPVTLAELKSQVHITHTIQDATLEAYLLAARLHAEEYQRMSYITQTWELTLDHIPNAPIKLLRGPVQNLLSVKIYDGNNVETNIDVSNFYLDTSYMPAKLALTILGEFPNVNLRSIGGLKIQYTAGYGLTGADVPANIKYAILLFASFADDNRAADETELPRAFWDLLRPTRIESNVPW